MIRKFNYTGRRRIHRRNVGLGLRQGRTSMEWQLSAEFRLDEYAFPEDAEVYLEAYRQTYYQRLSVGRVGQLQDVKGLPLTGIDDVEDLLFRVKVVGRAEKGPLLVGEGDRIPVTELNEESVKSHRLLKVRPRDNLDHQLFRVEEEGGQYFVEINKTVEDWRGVAAADWFRTIVAPGILREVLSHVMIVNGHYEADEGDSPSDATLWMRFASSLPGMTPFDASSSVSGTNADSAWEWINDASMALSRKLKMREGWMRIVKGE